MSAAKKTSAPRSKSEPRSRRSEPRSNNSPRAKAVSPPGGLRTVLEQCNHLLQLQDSLLRNSLNQRKEATDRSRLEGEELEKLRKELEVSNTR